jgi:hypothetical protein
MSGHTRRHISRPWVLSVIILALIVGPILLYKILPLAGLSAAAATGVVAIVAINYEQLLPFFSPRTHDASICHSGSLRLCQRRTPLWA